MTQSRFPEGWDEARVQRVLAHYEAQTETEAVAEDEAVARPLLSEAATTHRQEQVANALLLSWTQVTPDRGPTAG
jgi:hypothetical protein